jgi:hypothetical protein
LKVEPESFVASFVERFGKVLLSRDTVTDQRVKLIIWRGESLRWHLKVSSFRLTVIFTVETRRAAASLLSKSLLVEGCLLCKMEERRRLWLPIFERPLLR